MFDGMKRAYEKSAVLSRFLDLMVPGIGLEPVWIIHSRDFKGEVRLLRLVSGRFKRAEKRPKSNRHFIKTSQFVSRRSSRLCPNSRTAVDVRSGGVLDSIIY
jgi:hypothetical protein